MFLILDLETTGLHADKGDAIIDIAAMKVFPDGRIERFQSFVHPGTVHLSDFVLALTGIPKETILTAPQWSEVKEQFLSFLGEEPCPVIGHNVGFDIIFLRANGVDLSVYPVVDTNDWATFFVPEATSHSLEVLAEGFGIDHELKHTALGDVEATYALLRIMRGRYEKTWKANMGRVVTSLRQQYGFFTGWLFFDLDFPPLDHLPDFHLHESPGISMSTPLDVQPGALHLVPRMLHREEYLLHMFARGTYIVPASHLAQYHGKKGVVVFDRLRSFVYLPYLSEQFADGELSDASILLQLRIQTIWKDLTFIHTEAAVLTHSERRLLGKYSLATHSESQQAFAAYLATASYVVTTHHTYFSDDTHPYFVTSRVVIDDFALLEHYLYNVARLSLNFEYVQQIWQQLESQLTQTERAGVQDDMFALHHMVKYFFANLTKLMRGQQMLPRDEAHDMVRQFVHSFHRGSDMLLGALPEHAQHSLRYLQELFLSLLDEQDERCMYYFYMQMGNVSIIRERQTLDDYLDILGSKEVYYVDTQRLEHFPYLIDVSGIQGTQLPMQNNVRSIDKDLALRLEAHDQEVMQLLDASQKTVLIGGGLKMERIFDILFTHFAQTSTYVGMYGKSGGKGKILSRYHMSDAAIVLQSWKDLHNMAVDADRFVVMQLPFTVFAGQYFTQKYGQKSFAALTLPICVKQLTDLSAEVYARNPDADVWIADARIHLKGYGYDILQGCGLI